MKITFNLNNKPCLTVERDQWPDSPEKALQLVFELNYLPPSLYKISLFDEHNQHDYKKLLYDSHDSDVYFNIERVFDCPLYEKAVLFFERKVHKVNLFFIASIPGGHRESFEAEVEPEATIIDALHATPIFSHHPDLQPIGQWAWIPKVNAWQRGPVGLKEQVEADQLYIVDFIPSFISIPQSAI
ncbi:hypothetical protein M3Y98_01025900 [Aphelenchoides besseyi]|nr:hypothetical protein M3Y98_01025900 [Aphelenchoides besseyi]